MPGGRREMRVPDSLSVIVGVNIDKARCYDLAFGVDLLRAASADVPDAHDLSVLDRNVGFERFGAGPVDNIAVANDEYAMRPTSCALRVVYSPSTG